MKNLLLFIGFVCCATFCFSQTSNDIVYDLKKNKFTDSVKKLKKDDKGDIYLKYFNPFMYTVDVNTKTIDASKKVPGFIRNLFGANFEQKLAILIPPEENNEKNLAVVHTFNTAYEKYLKTYISLKKRTIDSKLFSNIPEGSLLKKYFEMIKATDTTFSNEKEQLIVSLETLINHLREYKENHENFMTKIGSFKISGEKTIISIELTPRENAKEFPTPLNTIKAKKVIKTDKKIHVWFSSGIMASKIVKNDYYVSSLSSNEHEIMTEVRGNYLPGINTLLHVGFENCSNMSIVIGGGVNVEGTSHLLAGVSFPLLESKNLSLSFGYGWSFIDTLSDKFSLNTVYAESPTIKTKKNLSEKEFWFGLSYKL